MSAIIGTGIEIPPFVVTNEDLEKFYPTGNYPYFSPWNWNAAWITHALGIKQRCFAFDLEKIEMRPGYYDLDLAEKASRKAIKDANINIQDIDLIIYATSTAEFPMPDPACMLHKRLAANENTAAFGLTSVGCGGSIYAMTIAVGMIQSGIAETVLVVTSTSTSSYMSAYSDKDMTPAELEIMKVRDRMNASIFGDGAGALIIQKSGTLNLTTYWGAQGIGNPVVFEAGGSRNPATIKTVRDQLHYFNMQAALVDDAAPTLFERTVQTILHRSHLKLEDISFFVFHQVNYRLLKKFTKRIGIPWDKVSVHVDRYGNLDTATLTVGYHEAITEGKIKKGDTVMFAAVGAGWQYGSMIMKI
jgi:3-oxoacyl-[acyl-carrier-protein] synthase-3